MLYKETNPNFTHYSLDILYESFANGEHVEENPK